MKIGDKHDTRAALEEMRRLVAAALDAPNTREMAALAAAVQATGVRLRLFLDDLLADPYAILDAGIDRAELEAARNALGDAIIRAEAVALGVDLPSMRARVQELQAATEEAISAIAPVFGLGAV